MNGTSYGFDQYTGEWECWECDEYYTRPADMRNHLFFEHNWCKPCDRFFSSPNALHSHKANSGAHNMCLLCDSDFTSDAELTAHYRSAHYRCEACSSVFKSEVGRHEHGRQKHLYCVEHRRAFLSPANYQAHFNSKLHQPAQVACPTRCGRSFVDRSALALHLESGTCSSGMNREILDYKMQQLDRGGLVTTRRLALPAPPSHSPSSSSASRQPKNLATEESWDYRANAYKCYFDDRLFDSLRALNQHLASPRHTYSTERSPTGEKLYHCPNRGGGACRKEFFALSALLSHVERGGCGARNLGTMMDTIDSVVGRMGRLTF
ncbi:hypothetical protein JCM11491_003399 [Sporobolomyces phaffii]